MSGHQNRLRKAAPCDGKTAGEPHWMADASDGPHETPKDVPVAAGQPSKDYEIIYQNLADSNRCWVGERIARPHDVVDIRAFESLDPKQRGMISSIRHLNFVTVHGVYRHKDKADKDKYYVVYEHMPRSLDECIGNPYLNSFRLAAVIKQVVQALSYLEHMNLQYGHLSCSRVLLHPTGRVKLFGQENCTRIKGKGCKDIRDLGRVMVELMEGCPVEGPNVGVQKPALWEPEVITFLSATTSATSTDDLLQHPFLLSCQSSSLQGLVALVMAWTKPRYNYVGRDPENKLRLNPRI